MFGVSFYFFDALFWPILPFRICVYLRASAVKYRHNKLAVALRGITFRRAESKKIRRKMTQEVPSPGENRKPLNEKWLLLVLAAIQFTATLDFLIIMPLGPQYLRVFVVSPAQFGNIVSAYALSAAVSGIVAGFFMDRFDRKPALLGFILGLPSGRCFARSRRIIIYWSPRGWLRARSAASPAR